MNNNAKFIFTFTLGAAAGAAVSWFVLKDKYAKIAQEEIDSVKEVYSKKKEQLQETYKPEEESETEDEPDQAFSDDEKEEYENITKIYKSDEEEGGNISMSHDEPYVIPPEEFGMADDYDTITLTYFAGDDVLADDDNVVVYDVDEVVGEDSLTHFGEYEDDTVYVRNERRKCDYEICMDDANYYDQL